MTLKRNITISRKTAVCAVLHIIALHKEECGDEKASSAFACANCPYLAAQKCSPSSWFEVLSPLCDETGFHIRMGGYNREPDYDPDIPMYLQPWISPF